VPVDPTFVGGNIVPSRPRTAAKAASQVEYKGWAQYVQEATASMEPFRQPLPPTDEDPEPEPAEIACPTPEQLTLMAAAQSTGSDEAAFVALFGEELAPRLLLATAGLPFVVRAKMIGDLMMHYGLQAAPNMPGVPNPE
jgi:hypothetical protein